MLEATVAAKYSKALLKIINSDLSSFESFKKAFDFLFELFSFSESRAILLSPIMPLAFKKELVSEALNQAQAPGILKEFFDVIIQSKRTSLIPHILKSFRQECLRANEILEADIFVAQDLPGPERLRFQSMLEGALQKKTEPNFHVDPDLLGGFVLFVNQKCVDLSLKSSLESLTIT